MNFRNKLQKNSIEKRSIITKVTLTIVSVGIVFFYSFVMSLIYPDSEAPWISILPIIIFLIIIPLLIWKTSLFVSENNVKFVSLSEDVDKFRPENKEQIKISDDNLDKYGLENKEQIKILDDSLDKYGLENKETIKILVGDMDDPVYKDCINCILQTGKPSPSILQRHLGIGYNRAARIIDVMEKRGVIGPARGSRPREVLLSPSTDNYELVFELTTIESQNIFDNSYFSKPSISPIMDEVSLSQLDSLNDGYEFEEFIAKMLVDYGYSDAFVTQSSNDYGVDVIAEKNSIVYAIQCKYYSTTVGNSAVQEIVSGMTHYKAHVGVVATNNYFTRQAKELAESNRIVLWNRDILVSMIEKAAIEKRTG